MAHPRRVARALRHPVRRAVLADVLERSTPVAVETLQPDGAAQQASVPGGTDGDASSPLAFHLRHVPILETAALVTLTDDRIAPGDNGLLSHPAVTAETLRRDDADWETLSAIYGQPRRWHTVAVLAGATLPLSVSTLARAVAAAVRGDLAPEPPIGADLAARLHHVDLPLLGSAGVLDYDADARRITAVGDSTLPLPIPRL